MFDREAAETYPACLFLGWLPSSTCGESLCLCRPIDPVRGLLSLHCRTGESWPEHYKSEYKAVARGVCFRDKEGILYIILLFEATTSPLFCKPGAESHWL